jgi:hypothetical protein
MQQVAEEIERGDVGPVEIVERQQQRPLAGEVPKRLAGGAEQAVALVGPTELGIREQRGARLERVDEHSEGHVLLEFGGAA